MTSPSPAYVEFTHEDEDCVCGPTAVPVKTSDGSVNWVFVHHSLDGRELHEDVT